MKRFFCVFMLLVSGPSFAQNEVPIEVAPSGPVNRNPTATPTPTPAPCQTCSELENKFVPESGASYAGSDQGATQSGIGEWRDCAHHVMVNDVPPQWNDGKPRILAVRLPDPQNVTDQFPFSFSVDGSAECDQDFCSYMMRTEPGTHEETEEWTSDLGPVVYHYTWDLHLPCVFSAPRGSIAAPPGERKFFSGHLNETYFGIHQLPLILEIPRETCYLSGSISIDVADGQFDCRNSFTELIANDANPKWFQAPPEAGDIAASYGLIWYRENDSYNSMTTRVYVSTDSRFDGRLKETTTWEEVWRRDNDHCGEDFEGVCSETVKTGWKLGGSINLGFPAVGVLLSSAGISVSGEMNGENSYTVTQPYRVKGREGLVRGARLLQENRKIEFFGKERYGSSSYLEHTAAAPLLIASCKGMSVRIVGVSRPGNCSTLLNGDSQATGASMSSN